MQIPADTPTILFVDDETAALKYFQRAVGSIGTVITAQSVDEGKRALDAHAATLCVLISDQRMPGAYGNELLEYAKDRYPHIVRILTTAYAEQEHTVDAVNHGHIYRYIAKPWDIASLRVEIRQAFDHALLARERDHLVREKMQVGRRQILWNRIGAIDVLCSMLSRTGTPATDLYLSMAHANFVALDEPDWALNDYVDIIGAEAKRTGEFGRRVMDALAKLPSHPGYVEQQFPVLLTELTGAASTLIDGKRTMTLAHSRLYSEFIDLAPSVAISERHVQLVSGMIRAANAGMLPHFKVGSASATLIFGSDEQPGVRPLATWLDNF